MGKAVKFNSFKEGKKQLKRVREFVMCLHECLSVVSTFRRMLVFCIFKT